MSEDAVEVRTKVAFQPFSVPTQAFPKMQPRPRQEGFKTYEGIPLEQLEPEVLDALAQRWLDNLYASVTRPSPFAMARSQ